MSQPPPLPPASDDQRFAPPQESRQQQNQRLQQLDQARQHLQNRSGSLEQQTAAAVETSAQTSQEPQSGQSPSTALESGEQSAEKSTSQDDQQGAESTSESTPASQTKAQATTHATAHKWLLWFSCLISVVLAVVCAVLLLDKFKPQLKSNEPGIEDLQKQYQQKLEAYNELNRQIIAQNRSELRLQHLKKLEETLSQSQANIAHIRQSIEKIKQQQQQTRGKIKLAVQDWVLKKQNSMRSQPLGDLKLGNGRELRAASIYRCYAEEVALHHEEGSLRVAISELPEWVQRRCGYILPEELAAATRGAAALELEPAAPAPANLPGGYEPPTSKPGLQVNPQAPGNNLPEPTPVVEPPDSGLLPPMEPDLPEPG